MSKIDDLRPKFQEKYGVPCPPQMSCYTCLKVAVEGDDGYVSDQLIKDIVYGYRERQKEKWLKKMMKQRAPVTKR